MPIHFAPGMEESGDPFELRVSFPSQKNPASKSKKNLPVCPDSGAGITTFSGPEIERRPVVLVSC